MKYIGDRFTLSTGRQFYANCGILGMSEEIMIISEGYDGRLYDCEEGGDEPLTPAERVEVAEYMINLWRKWGNNAPRQEEGA